MSYAQPPCGPNDAADWEALERRLQRARRRATLRAFTAMLIAILALAAIGLLAGCEARHVVHEYPDGPRTSYTRLTVFGDSSTEGVTVNRTAESLNVEVGATGSTSNAEQMLGLILDLARAGAAAGGVPVP